MPQKVFHSLYDQRWAQGSFVEAEAEVKAERSRQRRGKAARSLTEARQGRGRELEAEARQTKFEAKPRRGTVKSTLFVSFWYAHVVATCSCFVVNDMYQWKTLQEVSLKSIYQIPDGAMTEAETMMQSRGRGSKV